MQPGETVSRSPLDKPLHLLTEDDISQLTREDCRRFLKDKGVPLSPSLTPSLPLRLSQSHLQFIYIYNINICRICTSMWNGAWERCLCGDRTGMRRPSWNKSQAIQQVISLKALLETSSDYEATEAPKKLHIPRPENPPRVSSQPLLSPLYYPNFNSFFVYYY